MSIDQLKTRTRRPCRLALAIAVSALASAACVSPAFAGGGGFGGSPDGAPVNTLPPKVVTPNGTAVPSLCVTGGVLGIVPDFGNCGYAQSSFGGWTPMPAKYQVQWYDCDSSGWYCMPHTNVWCDSLQASLNCTAAGNSIVMSAPPYGFTDYPFIFLNYKSDATHTIRTAVTAYNSVGASDPAWSAPTPVITCQASTSPSIPC